MGRNSDTDYNPLVKQVDTSKNGSIEEVEVEIIAHGSDDTSDQCETTNQEIKRRAN